MTRFTVIYHISEQESVALTKAQAICLEQTVEVNDHLVPNGFIREQIVGQLTQFTQLLPELFAATISYAIESTAWEFTQLLNVIFGNTSLHPNIKVHDLQLPKALLQTFSGPQFGKAGLRKLLGVENRPLLSTALKPMGKTAEELAEYAYQFALGGLDIIKDDHGLTDQSFCRYEARVAACCAAVHRANQHTGRGCLYVPNVTAPLSLLSQRIHYAQDQGAGGLLLAPGLLGFETVRDCAKTTQLPLFSHPALLGGFLGSPNQGFAHGLLFGQLQRLIGADAVIYPNYGGRFGFTRGECEGIAKHCQQDLENLAPIFPMPGGGMTLEKLPDLREVYGNEVIFLIGGDLYAHSNNLAENARYFLSLVN